MWTYTAITARIHEAASDATQGAKALNTLVTLKFQGLEVHVHPGDTSASVARILEQAIENRRLRDMLKQAGVDPDKKETRS